MVLVDRSLGKLLPINADGFLVNDTSMDLIPHSLRPMIDSSVMEIRKELGRDLRSIYVRGSVPRGLSRGTASDLDFLVVLNDESVSGDETCSRLAPLLSASQDLVSRIDIEPIRESEYSTVPDLWYYYPMIKLQALLLFGECLASSMPPLRPNRALATTLRYLEVRTSEARQHLTDGNSPDFWIAWLMRSYVRAGLESVIERINGYSRDLPVCARSFAEYFPHLDTVIWRAVELAVDPRGKIGEMWAVVAKLEPILLGERTALGLDSATDNRVLKRKAR